MDFSLIYARRNYEGCPILHFSLLARLRVCVCVCVGVGLIFRIATSDESLFGQKTATQRELRRRGDLSLISARRNYEDASISNFPAFSILGN